MTEAGQSVPRTKFAVYCGANPGNNPKHLAMARELAQAMAKHNIGLGKAIRSLPAIITRKPELPISIPFY